MSERSENLWAPWRIEYIRTLEGEPDEPGCFLCRYWQQPEQDKENRVILRGKHTFGVLNRFPYTNGHLLIAPADHVADLHEIDESALHEMIRMTRDGIQLLRETLRPHGLNVGMNFGRCAGAGLPDHVHTHIVPRWNGDTNYMAVVGDVRVIPQALDALHQELIAAAQKLGLSD